MRVSKRYGGKGGVKRGRQYLSGGRHDCTLYTRDGTSVNTRDMWVVHDESKEGERHIIGIGDVEMQRGRISGERKRPV